MVTKARPTIVNRYKGQCEICHQEVPAGEGIAVKTSYAGWQVRHQPSRWVGSPVSGRFVGGC